MIITRLIGGMGNQMFQYAIGKALAVKNNTTLGLDLSALLDRTPRPMQFTFREYELGVFAIDAEIVSQSQIPFWYRRFPGRLGLYVNYFKKKFITLSGFEKKRGFDPAVLSLGQDAYLTGYWQSEQYFKDIEHVIRKDFSLKVELSEAAKMTAQQIESTQSVALHVRRGDYVSNKGANDVHGVQPIEYYQAAIALVLEKIPAATFFVFSDDIDWCKENIDIASEHYFMSPMPAHEHLHLMSLCDHNVIANSSFSWWGAWLNNNPHKIIVAPKQWYKKDGYFNNDLIPEDWITL